MRWTRALIAFSLLLTMVAAGSAAAPVSERSSYIVVFEPGATANVEATARQLTRAHGGELGFVYQHALQGFSVNLSAQAASALARNPMVAYVEADQVVTTADHGPPQVPTGIDRVNANENIVLAIDGHSDKRVVGVVVAVIDTGIDFSHPDLNVDTTMSVNCAGGSPFNATCKKGAGNDDNGHGTHVAGTIGALDNGANFNGIDVVGVAPGVKQWAVKVLRSDGSGYMSWIVAGIDYVTANAGTVKVANMSLGCECYSAAMNTAITNSVEAGVTYVVAAGNSAKDASSFSPANHPDVITVSALSDGDGEPGGRKAPTCRTDEDDTLANFSNYGTSVDVIAPGVCILSTVPGGYATYSGTSMASPHAAGAAALLVSSGIPVSSDETLPEKIRATLMSTGNTDDWTDDKGEGKEPRIDVAAADFNPRMSDGSGGGDGGGSDGDGGEGGDDGGGGEGDGGGGGTVGCGGEGLVCVGDLDAKSFKNKSLWNAEVHILVVSSDGSAVKDATVEGSWSPTSSDGSETVLCNTNDEGWCTVKSGWYGARQASVSWSVTKVTSTSGTYTPGANHDPDGDSNGTTIVVSKP